MTKPKIASKKAVRKKKVVVKALVEPVPVVVVEIPVEDPNIFEQFMTWLRKMSGSTT
jgi:hypothetical protein